VGGDATHAQLVRASTVIGVTQRSRRSVEVEVMSEFKGVDLSQLTDPQLLELLKRTEVEISMRRASARRLASDRGRIMEDAPPRFRNPENPAETWSGRGSRPAWVEIALGSGHRLEDLRSIDDHPVEHAQGRDGSRRNMGQRRRRRSE
jgi:hypothetical protein